MQIHLLDEPDFAQKVFVALSVFGAKIYRELNRSGIQIGYFTQNPC
jgi:hypothetical protein